MQQQKAPNDRPYRSHLRPACLACRRRKSRCQSEASSETCLMCRAHCTDCVFPAGPSSGPNRTPDSTRRRRQTRSTGGGATPVRRPLESVPGPADDSILPPSTTEILPILSSASNIPIESPCRMQWTNHGQISQEEEESPLALGSADDQQHNLHILGPAVTSDNQVLSDYLSAMPGATRGSRLVIPVPGNRSQPVLFTMVQKRPLGMAVNRSRSAEKLEMIERLLEPYEGDVIDVYFNKVNSSFPLLDEASFRRQFLENKERISPALLACLYAHSMTFWDTSPVLCRHRCPDIRFIWNLANEAIYSELHVSPGMSIIEAILLNVGGRPTTSLIGNGVLLGSAVAMAHSLGLHHNPIPWEIPKSEKYLRMKIWWALWVHDKWTSLAHGTPPHISRTHFNVPMPTLENLCPSGSKEGAREKASVFVALVGLTDVLDLNLKHIYHFELGEPRNTTHLELALNNWVESLDDDIRRIIIRGTNLEVPGAANLRLTYLTVRLLLERIKLEADKQLYDTGDSRLLNRYLQARRTSEEILILTQELQPAQLADFWLPSCAFAFPATVSFLLRCALETENSPAGLAQSSSLRIASSLISALRSHKEKSSWDLGDICLAQHAEVVEKVLAMVPTEDPDLDGPLDLQDFIMPDVSVIDQFFPSLWDPLQSAW
ncbi:fungal-specific transcription factor domain-containing protein [Dactylonectria macrodidyma]|uniref:Fungal-specific transcription factor domain-containing protein n=1 Tax=Dactylonectria macrodidyma TaxID=307937 RepID=A0A9P9JQT7_9HYPO|nr:fungal-specific transcription factor domain-containing protein [Dactylonectria macrodidyma]